MNSPARDRPCQPRGRSGPGSSSHGDYLHYAPPTDHDVVSHLTLSQVLPPAYVSFGTYCRSFGTYCRVQEPRWCN
jgi:hypothetical protein